MPRRGPTELERDLFLQELERQSRSSMQDPIANTLATYYFPMTRAGTILTGAYNSIKEFQDLMRNKKYNIPIDEAVRMLMRVPAMFGAALPINRIPNLKDFWR